MFCDTATSGISFTAKRLSYVRTCELVPNGFFHSPQRGRAPQRGGWGDRGGRGDRGGWGDRGGSGGWRGRGPRPGRSQLKPLDLDGKYDRIRCEPEYTYYDVDYDVDEDEVKKSFLYKHEPNKTVWLVSNAFKVHIEPKCPIQMYSIEIQPMIYSMRLLSILVSVWINNNIPNTPWIMGGRNLYLLKEDATVPNVPLKGVPGKREYFLQFKYVATVDVNTNAAARSHIINSILRIMLGKQFPLRLGRDQLRKTPVKKMRYMDVYEGATAPYRGRGFVCADVDLIFVDNIYKCLKTQTVWDTIKEYGRFHELPRNRKLRDFISHKQMVTNYGKRRVSFFAESLDFHEGIPLNKLRIDSEDENSLTFEEYYYNTYTITIDVNQPLIVPARQNDKSTRYLPQLCRIIGNLSPKDIKEMDSLTKIDARKRYDVVINNANTLQASKGGDLDKWNFTIEDAPLQFDGVYINPITLEMALRNSKKVDPKTTHWDQNTVSRRLDFRDPWIVFVAGGAQNSENSFFNKMKEYGMIANNQTKVVVFKNNELERKLNEELDSGAKYKFVLVIFSGRKGDNDHLYRVIKEKLDQYNVVSQCVHASVLLKHSALQKLCIQVVRKLGGLPWKITNWGHPSINSKFLSSMVICGIASSSTGGKRWLCMFTMYGSSDSGYLSEVVYSKQVTSAADGNVSLEWFENAFERHKADTGGYPKYLIIYREGGVRGRDAEINSIAKLVKTYNVTSNGNQVITMQYICVIGRIKTRIMAVTQRGTNVDNLEPGTLIDTHLVKIRNALFVEKTTPEASLRAVEEGINAENLTHTDGDPHAMANQEADSEDSSSLVAPITHWPQRGFILQSHVGKTVKGTKQLARPTRYEILFDTTIAQFDQNVIVQLTYGLCLLYFNMNNPISVPSPVRMAQRGAILCSKHLNIRGISMNMPGSTVL